MTIQSDVEYVAIASIAVCSVKVQMNASIAQMNYLKNTAETKKGVLCDLNNSML